MDNNAECEYSGYAQWFQMLYLITIYCIVFVYAIFLITIKETMKRFYALMELSDEDLRRPIRVQNINILFGRSFNDMIDSLAYSLYLIHEGRIGSRAEREYIQAEKAKRQMALMSNQIKEYKYEINEEEEDLEKAGGKGAKGAKVNGTINDEDFNASLLSSESDKMSESSSGLSSSQSVQPKTKGKGYNFFYKQCTICLGDFEKGEQVRVVPHCGHTFHKACLE